VSYVLLVSGTSAKDDTVYPPARRFPTRSAIAFVTPRYTHTTHNRAVWQQGVSYVRS
jgi:hypothetical protein